MSVPIYTSPGRDGFGPQLSLAYDSGSGDGVFGVGWSMALPAITRKTDKGLPRYLEPREFDVFILSGSEDLVPELASNPGDTRPPEDDQYQFDDKAINGYLVRRYRPRIEGLFARIERWTRLTDGDTYWCTYSKDNVLSVFGRTSESRIANPEDVTQVFSWLICESYDAKGNAIVYDYVPEDAGSVDLTQANERHRVRTANRYLKSIRYGNQTPILLDVTLPSGRQSHNPAPDLSKAAWMFELVFDYGGGQYLDFAADANGRIFSTAQLAAPAGSVWPVRQDPNSSYRSRFEIRCYRLCRRALMFHHFNTELGTADYLVRATEFSYSESPNGSFITQVLQSGYKRQQNGRYLKRSLPPIQFTYSTSPLQDGSYATLPVQTIDTASSKNLPAGIDSPLFRWVDLHGEGISGVLTEQADTWWYKPNLGEGVLGPAEHQTRQPSWRDLRNGRGQLLDLAGSGMLDLVQLDAPVPGFFERGEAGMWDRFRAFQQRPNLDWQDANLAFVDLTGDGLADVLVTSDQPYGNWYASLGEQGFAAADGVSIRHDAEQGPRPILADQLHGVFLADMSGDGLLDLVRIRQGEVCYWPNIGYGRFGAKVTLDNAPCFDDSETFDARRIRLSDTDGSGPADILYLGRDGIRIYLNQRGNSLSDARLLAGLPIPDKVASVSVVDFLGRGTACVLWSSPLPADSEAPLRYLDLMNGVKPNLLLQITNNLGSQTTLEYRSSTQFYLADKAAGTPWVTRLPFPVQVVSRVETYDAIGDTRFVTTYSYHHGYFDAAEREFRGFGRVDQQDCEEFGVAQSASAPAATNQDAAFAVPPVLTKTWFHTGAYLQGQRISRQFEREYFREGDSDTGQSQLSDAEFEALLLADTIVPDEVPNAEIREAVRSLKGSILRREVYGLDGSEAVDRPYSVSERNYTIARLQPLGMNRHAVYFTHARETVDYHYERRLYSVLNGQIVDAVTAAANSATRRLADPRVTHSMILEADAYGNILKSLSIAYGRRFDSTDAALTASDRSTQKLTLVTLLDATFTNALDGATALPDAYRTPLPGQTSTYELINLPAALLAANPTPPPQPDITNLLQFPAISALLSGPTDGAVEIPYEDVAATQAPAGILCRRMIEATRTVYRSDDLTQLLPLSSMQALALPGQSYRLAFTPGLLTTVYQRPHGGQPVEALLPSPLSVLAGDATHFADRGGYVDLDGDSHWWIPSGRKYFHSDPTATAQQELAEAAAHFFAVRRVADPFLQSSQIDYVYDLFPSRTIDAVANTVLAVQDYRVLQPQQLTDPNGNQSFAAYDALGLLVATATCGKSTEQLGDSLQGFGDFDADPALATLQSFMSDPIGQAAALLKTTTSRFVYDLERYGRCGEAPCAATLARETHVSDLNGGQTKIQLSLLYSDGLGRELQTKIQAAPGPAPQRTAATSLPSGDVLPGTLQRDINGALIQGNSSPRWIGKGRTTYNNKGKAVKQYEPFFSSTALCEVEAEMTDTGVTPILFYDPIGRVVATFFPDHSYQKVIVDPWYQARWDRNDTVNLNPKIDPDVAPMAAKLPNATCLPTWYQTHALAPASSADQASAAKTVLHANTPELTYADSLGRNFLVIADNGVDGGGDATRFRTVRGLDIEGNQRTVIDAVGRLVMRYDYDMLSNRIHQSSMEAGERWVLNDVTGKPIRAWDSRDHNITCEYDVLRRPTLHIARGTSAISDPRTLNQDVLVEKTEYGEGQTGDTDLNLRTRVVRHSDTSGILTIGGTDPGTTQTVAYDYKGNLLRSSRQLVADYKLLPDWSNPPPPDPSIYAASTRYDALNRAIQSIAPHSSQLGATFNVLQPSFNETGLLDGVDVWLSQAAEPAALLDPATTSPSAAGVTSIDYDPKGQRLQIQYRNSVKTTYGYDPLTYRLVRLVTQRPATSFPDDCPANPPTGWPGCQAQNLSYFYDPVGNVTFIADAAQQTIYFRNKRVEPNADYTYDPVYRIIKATGRENLRQIGGSPISCSYNDAPRVGIDWSANDGQAMGTYTETYTYDDVGNFQAMKHAGNDPANPGWVRNYIYAEPSQLETAVAANRLTSTTVGSATESYSIGGNGYDLHGNMLQMPQLQIMQWDFADRLQITQRQAVNTADQDGQLHQGERTYYIYDSGGERVRKVTELATGALKCERRYLGGFEQYISNGSDGVVRETLHVMDDKQRIALVETKTVGTDPTPVQLIRYQFSSHLGSALLELDAQANIISYEEYSPYGSTTYQAVSSTLKAAAKRYRFTGKERDEESGFSYHSARYLAPWLGRWTSCDPKGLVDGSNVYGYARGNPINATDTNGTDTELTSSIDYAFRARITTTHDGSGSTHVSLDASLKVSTPWVDLTISNHQESTVSPFVDRETGRPEPAATPVPKVQKAARAREPQPLRELPPIKAEIFAGFQTGPVASAFEDASSEAINPSNSSFVRGVSSLLAALVAPLALAEEVGRGMLNIPHDADIAGVAFARARLEPTIYGKVDAYAQSVASGASAISNTASAVTTLGSLLKSAFSTVVYQLVDEAGEAVYYGVSKQYRLFTRLGEHAKKFGGNFRAMQVISGPLLQQEALLLESELISTNGPILNTFESSITSPMDLSMDLFVPKTVPPTKSMLNPALYRR